MFAIRGEDQLPGQWLLFNGTSKLAFMNHKRRQMQLLYDLNHCLTFSKQFINICALKRMWFKYFLSQLNCISDEHHSRDSWKMTAAFKFVFVILLELCLFVEYDLGKSNHINVVLYPRNRPGRLICITTRIVWALSVQYDAEWKFSIMNQWPGLIVAYSKSGQNGRKKASVG